MPTDDEREYEVGYGKPPPRTRFKKGQSGNPKGRPRQSKNITTLLEEAQNELVVVRENGRPKRISKRYAAAKQLANKAASGDFRAIQLLLAENRQAETKIEATGKDGAPLTIAVARQIISDAEAEDDNGDDAGSREPD